MIRAPSAGESMGGMETAARTLMLALVAAASPMALTATLVVLKSRLARLNGLFFAGGFFFGEAVGWSFALIVGSAFLGEGDSTVAAALELLLGAFLLAAAWRVRRGAPVAANTGSPRTEAVLARLEHLNVVTALVAGTVLGIGVPRRLTLTLVAAAGLTTSGLSDAKQLTLVGAYMLVAAVLVWVPVAVYIVLGRRAEAWLEDGQAWLVDHRRGVAVVTLLVFGGLLFADGLAQLLG